VTQQSVGKDLEAEDMSVTTPATVADIDREWMQAALGVRYPELVVRSCEVKQVIGGTGTKVKVAVGYDEGPAAAEVPGSLVVKAGLEEHSPPLEPYYANESLFYAQVAPELNGNQLPRSYYADTDQRAGRSVVIMEDLDARGASYGDATRPLDVDTAAETLRLLARVHGVWWESPELTRRPWLGEIGAALDRAMCRFTEPDYFDDYMNRPRGATTPRQWRDPTTLRAAYMAARASEVQGPHCLLHGDPHLGNTFFVGGAPGLLDWQCVLRGSWAHDFTYFLVSALDPDDRATAERDLLAHYLDCLAAEGIADRPSVNEAWLAYRRQVAYGYILALSPVEMQSEAVCTEIGLRFGQAAQDLDSPAALVLAD
jgi:Phosphotransferase enzyme family